MIEIEHLCKRFGPVRAVDDLSFTVSPGEVLGFLGPNGAGKSTTMKMITGFLAPDSGQIRVAGHDIVQAPMAAKRVIGYLPEGAPSYGDMTVLGFLRFVAEARGLTGAARRRVVLEACDRLQLGQVLHQPIDTLSKGFRRRVGLAQAILHDPPVLILDEPTDGLDPNQKQQVRDLIRNLSQEKIVVVSTHILEEVSAVCSRAMIIASGRTVADGTPGELQARSRYAGAVTLVFSEAVPGAANVLLQVPGVEHIEALHHECEFTVFPKDGAQVFAAVNALVSQQNWPLAEIRLEQGRLDEVFRTVTEEVAA